MPVFTDSMLVGEVVRRAEEQLHDRVLFTPLMWLGNSEHHLDFAGTMSASPRAYIDLLVDMIENFITHGFQRIVLVNGHGGNNVPASRRLFEVRQKHRQRDDLLLLFACYWALGAEPHEADPSIEQQAMGHACEWETSMILALAPQLVGDYQKAATVDPAATFDPAQRAWTTKDRSAAGHIGNPRVATAAKGETLLALFTADVVDILRRDRLGRQPLERMNRPFASLDEIERLVAALSRSHAAVETVDARGASDGRPVARWRVSRRTSAGRGCAKASAATTAPAAWRIPPRRLSRDRSPGFTSVFIGKYLAEIPRRSGRLGWR